MKVALDARALTWATTRGIGRYQFNLANELIKLGVEIFLVVEKTNFFITPPQRAKIIEVPVSAPKKIKALLWSQIALPRKIKQLPIDLYHNTADNGLPLFCPVPSVITIHDISPLLFPQFSYNFWPLSRKIIYKTHLLINKFSKAEIIAVSKTTKNDLVRHFKINPARINVVYNGFNPPKLFSEQKIEENLKRFPIKSDYFLFVGGIEPRKNLLFLVKAFNRYLQEVNANEVLVISGETEKYIEAIICCQEIQEYFKTAEGAMVKNKVIFTGEVSEEEKASLMKKSIALVYPSVYEGFGFPPLEAASIGVPVITSPVSGMLEVAKEFALFASPDNLKELSEAFKKIKNKDLRNKLVAQGLIRARQFSWTATAKKTLLVYEKILNKSARATVIK
ncbi:hypothetical protein A2961_05005 [Candidatus Woesebacteria bacterium RIFCSPLOWO2_01_FULL_39_21]|uniref:Glycosyl transferase family 1 domain-containing protein n=1 Tax=Candidatus Woesebacteria bacterium RIFCSPLOWO2_01_FULL_39_21 TaxID=1802519 RepID=A0A1F8BDJ0_9BACT|nr:MAG: hypothetical protein A2691_03380 [Candidatus Woesebacteria bacterium RIFCSPHIGHO2_01_FULL_39_23]OGM62102.1 MAG: hypothetical protein A2961_05005 [Candidatus Woesebacteria bacterium RIFCSPLOWO2_01_FULL_39_21]